MEKDIRQLQIQMDNALRSIKFLILTSNQIPEKVKVDMVKALED